MKRMFKSGLIILVVGLVFVLGGYFFHGKKSVVFHGFKPMIEENIDRTANSYQFDKIKLRLTDTNVRIEQGSEYAVHYHGRSDMRPQLKEQDGELTLTGTTSETKHGMLIGNDLGEPRITITVPKDKKLKKLQVQTSGGDFQVRGISAKKVDLNLDDSDEAYLNGVDFGGGQIKLNDTDFSVVNKSVFKQVAVKAYDTDWDISSMTVNGGSAYLDDGDFTAHNLTVKQKYQVTNSEDSNVVTNAKADGFVLKGGEHNSLYGKTDSDYLEKNPQAKNVLKLRILSSDGSNVIK